MSPERSACKLQKIHCMRMFLKRNPAVNLGIWTNLGSSGKAFAIYGTAEDSNSYDETGGNSPWVPWSLPSVVRKLPQSLFCSETISG